METLSKGNNRMYLNQTFLTFPNADIETLPVDHSNHDLQFDRTIFTSDDKLLQCSSSTSKSSIHCRKSINRGIWNGFDIYLHIFDRGKE